MNIRINILAAFLLLSPLFLAAQYPANPGKMRLGFQTTAAGLVYHSNGAPAHTPSNYLHDTWMAFDTVNNVLYYYDENDTSWHDILDGVPASVPDSVYVLPAVADTSFLAPEQGDIFINSGADTLGVFDSWGWRLFFGGGSTEVADGFTILGDGTGGDPFRVDTGLVATRHYADSLFAAADSLRELGDKGAPILIPVFDRLTQLNNCATSLTVNTGFILIDDTAINEGDVVFEINASPATITYDLYNEDSTAYYFEEATPRTANTYFWEVGYTDADGNFVGDLNSFDVIAGRPDTVTVWTSDTTTVTRVCGTVLRRDTISEGNPGTVTSVGLTLPSQFSVSGSPVTTSGTLAGAWVNQASNTVLAGPVSGGSAAPAFRGLVNADITAGGGVTGAGVANAIPYWDGVSNITYDNNRLTWNPTTDALGIGTGNPTNGSLHIVSTGTPFFAQSSFNGLVQNTFYNASPGTAAQMAVVVSSNASSFQIGMNSSGYTGSTAYGQPNDIFLRGGSGSGNFYWNTASGKTHQFLVNGTKYASIGVNFIELPMYTTASRPTGSSGYIGHNSTLGVNEAYYSAKWNQLVGTTLAAGKFTAGMVPWADSDGNLTGSTSLLYFSGSNMGIGTATPTARLHLPAGTTAASTGPLKFTSGPLMTTPEVGAVEFLTDRWYGTITTGTARKQFAFTDEIVSTVGVNLATDDVPRWDGSEFQPSSATYDGTTWFNFPDYMEIGATVGVTYISGAGGVDIGSEGDIYMQSETYVQIGTDGGMLLQSANAQLQGAVSSLVGYPSETALYIDRVAGTATLGDYTELTNATNVRVDDVAEEVLIGKLSAGALVANQGASFTPGTATLYDESINTPNMLETSAAEPWEVVMTAGGELRKKAGQKQHATYYEEERREYILTPSPGADTVITVDTIGVAYAADSISISAGLIENLRANTVTWLIHYDFTFDSDEDACQAFFDLTTDGSEVPTPIAGSFAYGNAITLFGSQFNGRSFLVDVPSGQSVRLCVKGNVIAATEMNISYLTITIQER